MSHYLCFVQAILALVHDLGSNWELVSDVLSSNSQIKVRGVYIFTIF